MCYSAMIWADYRQYLKLTKSKLGVKDFLEIFWWRYDPDQIYAMRKVRVPKALERAFMDPDPFDPDQVEIKRLIDAYYARQESIWAEELRDQSARLDKAERLLAAKPDSKTGLNEKRVATNKIDQYRGWLDDIHRTEPRSGDSRIFPGSYAPVLVWEDGQRVIKPMRYHCRPQGVAPDFDVKFPGCYNARRNNLGKFWRNQFGHKHAVMVVERFFENVERTRPDGKKYNTVLEFKPADNEPMFVACVWSRWSGKGEPDLQSFAAITDEPPPEVAAAGHDRCIVPIQREHIDRWLQPDPGDLAAMYAILDDRERPYYEHRQAA
ncbi:MAG TPA: SOS response-associated peptidase family protein [Ramlibacter sp.]|nr:SOS response-associated peptidase family protein [Ramlibacter sp.]